MTKLSVISPKTEINNENVEISRENYDYYNKEDLIFKAEPGISEELVREISKDKNEPEWMLQKRLTGLRVFLEKPVPTWGPDLSDLNIDDIILYMKPNAKKNSRNWSEVPEDIRKTYEKLGIPQAEQRALGGVGAQYECLSENSIILTNNEGPKEIKNIKKGDFIFALNEKENKIEKAKVLAVKDNGENFVFEIIVDNKKIKATENHPFLVLSHYKKAEKIRGRYKREWRQLKDLKIGDLVAIAKKLPNEGKNYILEIPKIKEFGKGRNQFGINYNLPLAYKYKKVKLPNESSNDLLWFLGLYLGDGYIHKTKGKDKKGVQFAIPETQIELRNELKKIIKNIFDYQIISEDKDRISINSTVIANFVELNGFKGNAHQKRVPNWIFNIPREQQLNFLAGYTDSDGYPTDERKSNVLIFRSPNKKLINDFRNLTIYCDLHPSNIHLIKSKHPFNKERIMISYQIDISGNLKVINSRYTPKSLRLKAKNRYHNFSSAENTTFRKYINDYLGFAKIESIIPAGKEKVYDIEVEGYHNFVADGLIVHNSEIVYHNLKRDLEEQGVVFLDMDQALIEYPELVKKYFMTTCIPINLHKYSALHAAVWSGGTFIYVPKGIKVNIPLQAYFRMNAKKGGQFEHTLIIVDEGAEIHYIEGCSAPIYSENSLHAGGVEIHVLKNARVRYSSIENWSKNTYNLNTKRAVVYENGIIEWVNGNLGSKISMLYPCSVLFGKNSKSDYIGIQFAGQGQYQDTGCKVYHYAPNTSSTILSKGISKNGGVASYRGLIFVKKGCKNVNSLVKCDGLMLDNISKALTFPSMEVEENDVKVAHEASVGKVGEDQLFYLMSRGLSEEIATNLIVSGFIEPIIKELPLEYAVELNRLIELEIENSVC